MAKGRPQKRKEPLNYFKAAVFFITLGFMPLIVRFAEVPITPEETLIMPGTESHQDMFSYYKSWIFAVCTMILGLNSLWDFFSANAKFDYRRCLKNRFTVGYAALFTVLLVAGVINNVSGGGPAPSNQIAWFLIMMFLYTAIFLPQILTASFKERFETHIPRPVAVASVVFLLCVFATTAFTDYRALTFSGAVERYENVFAILGYIIILIEVADFAAVRRGSRIVFAAIIFSATAIGMIGFFQLLGMDVFYTSIANRLVLGDLYNEGVRLTPRFRQAYATLYNPNSVGMYASMMGPFAFAAACLWPRKSPMKYILFATAAFGTICMFGSNSTAGLAGFAAAFGAFLVLLFANFVKNKRSLKIFAALGATAVIAFAGLLIVPATGSRIMLMMSKVFEMGQTDAERGYFADIEAAGDTVRIIRGEDSISITTAENGAIHVSDKNGNVVEPVDIRSAGEGVNEARYSLPDWLDFSLTAQQSAIIYREDAGFTLFLGVDGERNIHPLQQNGTVADLTPTPSIGFENSMFLASSRGYIWAKTLPMLADSPARLLIGNGVDSYVVSFPQDDIIGKTRFFGNPYIIVDKAHNMYLQTAVTTGILSVLAQVALFGIFLFWAVKKIIAAPKLNTPYVATLMGSAAGIVGFMITGLSTDSIVSVSPIFWAVLGLGYACVYALNHGSE